MLPSDNRKMRAEEHNDEKHANFDRGDRVDCLSFLADLKAFGFA